jgi:hypothetical protein
MTTPLTMFLSLLGITLAIRLGSFTLELVSHLFNILF